MPCNYEEWGSLPCVQGAENALNFTIMSKTSTATGVSALSVGDNSTLELVSQGRKRKIQQERRQARREHAQRSKAAKKEAVRAAASSTLQRVMVDMSRENITLPFSIHSTHDCVECGIFVACIRCGSSASCAMKGNRLERECRAQGLRGGAAHRLERLLWGKLPRTEVKAWPNGAEAPRPRRIRTQSA